MVKEGGEVKITVKMSENVIRNYITNHLKLYIVHTYLCIHISVK